MAFKSVEQFNDDRYHGMFRLVNDGDASDVVFLYQSVKDMLVAPAHYIKSTDYSGYVHCCGENCPACKKGIRVQTKLFIPVYNIDKNSIEFWDKTMKFEPVMEHKVFNRFSNPSEFVFRITRHGVPNDFNTTYDIDPVGKNISYPYTSILAKFNTKMPDAYSIIIKEVSVPELTTMLQNSGNDSNDNIPDYNPVPRAGYQSSIPETYVDASVATASSAETVAVNFTPSADVAPAPNDDFVDDGDDDKPLADPQF